MNLNTEILLIKAVVIIFILGTSLPAQSVLDNYIYDNQNSFVHNSWSLEDGIPVNSINDILQDQSGYIWLATYDGLVRFNGTSFKTFRRSEYPSLLNNRMDYLFEDSNERIWILGEYETLIKYENHEFTTYNESNGFTNSRADHIVEDSNGVIWIGTEDGVFSYSNNTIRQLTRSPVNDLVIGSSDTVWVASGNVLQRINNQRVERVEVFSDIQDSELIKLHVSQNNELWLVTKENIWKKFGSKFVRALSADLLGTQNFAVFLEMINNDLLIGGNNGLYHLTEINGVFSHRLFLQGVPIRAIQEDSNGRIWVISWTGELFLLNSTMQNAIPVSKKLGFQGNRLSGVMEDKEGNLWFIADPGGLHQLESSFVQSITTRQGLSVDNVISIYEDYSQQIWVGTRDGGLNLITDKEIRTFSPKQNAPMDVVYSIAQHQNGKIWVGTYRNGFFTMNADGSEIRKIQGLSSEIGGYAIHHNDEATWLGTEAGLIKIVGNTQTVYDENDGLPHPFIRVIVEDASGGLWLGTNGGGVLPTSKTGMCIKPSINKTDFQVTAYEPFILTRKTPTYCG